MVAVFPIIRIELTINYLKEWLEKIEINKDKLNELVNLTKHCMNLNVFQSNNNSFEQTNGTAMRNSLFSFLAVVFMSKFEIDFKKQFNFPTIWFRYVDDIFAIVDK